MDDGGPNNGRHRIDPYKGVQTPWNAMPPYQMKEMNAFVMHIYAEKHAALQELDRVITEKNIALEERNEALKLRDEAVAARDNALRERDRVIAALQFQENSMNGDLDKRGIKRAHQIATHNQVHFSDHGDLEKHGIKRVHQIPTHSQVHVSDHGDLEKQGIKRVHQIPTHNRVHVSDHYPSSEISSDDKSSSSKAPKKGKFLSEDLNTHVSTEDDSHDIDLMNQINFDEGAVPPPVCSCTGVPRQCYKSGNGGWQSSCCTITLSVYPLPQLPNKRHSRMGGRKMSGNVFSRLVTRLAEEGHDLSVPVDLKSYWAKHGTNRYITVK